MERRTFLAMLTGSFLAAPLAAEAQREGRVYRIGLLEGPFPPIREARSLMGGALHSLGYVEGRNAIVERVARTNEELAAVASELARSGVDVIVALGLPVIRAAKDATKTVPIVMFAEGDPVRAGLVSSLGRPGRNVTGLTLRSPELAGKQLELLKEAVPGLVRVGVLWNPDNLESVEYWQAAQQASRLLGLELRSLELDAAREIESLFDIAARERCGALIVSNDYLSWLRAYRIIALAQAKRMPAMYTSGSSLWVKVLGGLMSYGVDEYDLFRRLAGYVDRILKGANPTHLPIEQPTKFALIVNLKAAKGIRLTIPQSLLLRADQVIE
jgi:putative tryptophan/tyrosine transport system substrate-binding protein